ncbi:hypothetical protein ANCCEY_03420 [Ancylostoma ceylanicum]|uniref:Rab3-GAP regulatory subunit N-terminal domain-containing protein n=1 Tax=Ancylostoma ceylanicum TaxID=53326 RepID=A0A0D6M541_9BILA|nr:hypothetical protein ANCCEY_03420 [Ancylostoma ceylanicum]
MAVSFTLEENLFIEKELATKVKDYLLGGNSQESRSFVKRSVSTSSDEEDSRDTEKPAGVRDWDFPAAEEEPLNPSSEDVNAAPLGWLSQCFVVTYNSLDYMLLLNRQRFVLLTRSTLNEKQFEIRCMKELDYQLGFAEEDTIMCGCLFGLGTHRTSEPLDCLIVALGMSNGHVVFFTENGTLLFFEQFSESDILWISFEQTEDSQQLTVVTAKDFFAVDPIGLHSTLLKAKATIAKGEKTAEQLSKTLEMDVDRLKPEKGTKGLRHVLFTGVHKQSVFEQYSTASIVSYNEAISSAAPPLYSMYLYTSDRIFSTFAWTTDADRKKIWSEAIKYGKSFVPHFGFRDMLGISSAPRKKTPVAQESHVVTTRGVLGDSRLAVEVALEAQRGLVAIVDHVARVVLIDVLNRQIIRIWKGYRDATVAWVTSVNNNQSALFLAIFAPRRALLEVWSVQSGVRVGAVHVDAAGVLLDGGTATVLCGSHSLLYERDAFFVDSQFSPSSDINSIMPLFSSLRLQKSKRELLLMILPFVNDPSSLQSMLDKIGKSDGGAGPLEDLLCMLRRLLGVFSRLAGYHRRERKHSDSLESHFNEQIQEVIRRHCLNGESIDSQHMKPGEFLSFIDCRSTNSALWERNYPDSDVLRFGEFVFGPVLLGQLDVEELFDTVLPELPFAMSSFPDLLTFVLTKSPAQVGCLGFMKLCEMLTEFERLLPGTLDKCEKTALECRNLSRALLLYSACCIVGRKQSTKNESITKELEEDVNMSGGDDWEAVNPESEHADCTILTMHAAWLAGELGQSVPYSKVVSGAGAFFREQIASLAAREHWASEKLEDHLTSVGNIVELRELLPYSLKLPLLHCEIAWELMSLWFKDSISNFDNMELALRHLGIVEDCRLRHGVIALMWQNFIMERFKAVILLIEKTGRAPKEREARQQLQMSEIRIAEFLSRCHELLKMLMDDVRDSPPPSHVQKDHFIEIAQSHPPSSLHATISSRDSLVELANRQSLVNYHLVLHHYHLAVAAAVQLSSGLRVHILRILFCPIGQRAFFHPLDSHPLIPLDKVDDAVMERRNQFLEKVAEQGSDSDRRLARILSCEWNLTVDTIQTTQVLCHLRAGQDEAASREMAGIAQSEHFVQTMTRLLAARTLRLAEEENTVLTSAHMSFLTTTAGDEKMRVDWSNSDWKEAVRSFGKIVAGLSLQPQFLAPFIRIGGITTQYWGIPIVD